MSIQARTSVVDCGSPLPLSRWRTMTTQDGIMRRVRLRAEKAPEDWRSPEPGGTLIVHWHIAASFLAPLVLITSAQFNARHQYNQLQIAPFSPSVTHCRRYAQHM